MGNVGQITVVIAWLNYMISVIGVDMFACKDDITDVGSWSCSISLASIHFSLDRNVFHVGGLSACDRYGIK